MLHLLPEPLVVLRHSRELALVELDGLLETITTQCLIKTSLKIKMADGLLRTAVYIQKSLKRVCSKDCNCWINIYIYTAQAVCELVSVY